MHVWRSMYGAAVEVKGADPAKVSKFMLSAAFMRASPCALARCAKWLCCCRAGMPLLLLPLLALLLACHGILRAGIAIGTVVACREGEYVRCLSDHGR
jgi:hypothetical protein